MYSIGKDRQKDVGELVGSFRKTGVKLSQAKNEEKKNQRISALVLASSMFILMESCFFDL